jgi:hypothetical protein
MKKTTLFAAFALAALATAAPLSAQDGYLFGTPRLSLTVRAGAAAPAANGEIYDFMTNQLTLDRNDFTSASFGADLGVRIHPQVDLMLSIATAHSSNDSEFRDFVETNDEPIRQTTDLTRTPVTAGLKIHLMPRGRSISRYAYVPTRFSPYVGGGAGVMFYRLEQYGDFVDFETLDIFTDQFESNGETFTANAFAGGDFWLATRVGLNVEARYNWAKADLNYDFSDFGEIDLKGWQLTAGISLRH